MSGPGLLVRAGLGVLFLTAALGTPADADLWGHLTFGRDIVSTGHVVQVDRYSFTSDRPWVNHEWLAEVTMAQSYRVAGPAGLVGLKVVVIAALLLLLWRHVRRLHPSAPITIALIALAFLGTFWRTHTVRPQLFSVLFFAVLLIAMVRFDEGRRRVILVAPLLLALWVNVHGGWIVGLAVLGLWTAARIFDWRSGLAPAHRLMLASIGLLSVGATLVNPYGLEMWTFLSETVRLGRDDIEEWGSILTHPMALGLPWLLMLSAAVFAVWRSPQLRRYDYLTIVGLLGILSFRVSRLDAFFGLTVCVLLTPGLVGALRSVASAPRPPSPPRPISAGVLAITIITIGVILVPAAPLISRYSACLPIDGPWVPEPEAARFIARNRLTGKMVTWFDWGQYAIWHFGPDLRVSMDGRRETVYSEQTIQAHRRFYAADDTALPYLRTLDPDYIWMPRRVPIATHLVDAGWTTVFSGPTSIVFARPGAGPFEQVATSSTAMRCFPGP
jgi:hypothetical protein